MSDSLLSGLRALDLTDEKGFICGQILASLGVDVIKVEKPGGDSSRNIPPFYHNRQDPGKSLYWFAFNAGKRDITLNLETQKGREIFLKLAEKSDFVLESFPPGHMDSLGLGYEALSRVNRRIIVTSITHFGQKGPRSYYKSSELTDSAMSGLLADTGHPDRPPVKEALDSLYFHAGAAAALGTLISYHFCVLTGEGQQVDVSIQEVATSRAGAYLLPWQWDNRLIKRSGALGQFGTLPVRKAWPCKDGYVFWMLMGGPVGAPANKAISQWLEEDGVENPLVNIENWEELDLATMSQEDHDGFHAAIGKFFLKHTKQEIAEEGSRRGIRAAAISNVEEVLQDKHLSARDFWVELDNPDLDMRAKYPRHFFVCSETNNFIKCHAPRVGQDNSDFYEKELNLSDTEIATLQEMNVI